MGIFLLILLVIIIVVVLYQGIVSRTPQQIIRDLKDAQLIFQ